MNSALQVAALTMRVPLGIIESASRNRHERVSKALKQIPLLAFILRRILQSLAVMTVVAFIAFALFNFTGDPVTFMVGQDATQEDRARLRADLGLDQPFYVQFGRFVERAVHGEFGLSLRQGRPVSTLLKERVPATLELALAAALLALALGIPAGVYTALRRNSVLSQFLLAISLIGVSLPTFLIGIL